MFILVVSAIAVISLLAAVGVVALVLFGLTSTKRRKARRQALLADSSKRLKIVVAELLEKVNELDMQFKFLNKDERELAAYKSRLSVVAEDLVTVTDTLPSIDQLLSEKRFNDAADLLSASCRLIEKVLRVMTQLEPSMQGQYSIRDANGVRIKLSEKDVVSEKSREK